MWSEQFIDKKSRLITIKLDVDSGHAEAWDGTALVGHLDWSMHAVGLDWQGESIEGALLTNIYLDNAPGYTKSGIGTRIVELIRDILEPRSLFVRILVPLAWTVPTQLVAPQVFTRA